MEANVTRPFLVWFMALLLSTTVSAYAAERSERIPHRTVYAVRCLARDNIWIGTEDGAARFDGKAWTIYRTADGLPHQVVTSIAQDPTDGTLWFGTFGGIARFRGDRFEAFSTSNSGLINDVVYAVTVTPPYVWAATTNGLSRYQPQTREWKGFNDQNAPMHEVWCYGATTEKTTGETWFAIWGSGILRVKANGEFVSYIDPDEIFDVDVVRNDGPLHEIQVTIDSHRNIVYSGAYFGLTRFDTATEKWNTWTIKDPDSGLPSDFINAVRLSPDGSICAIGTDKGLCLFNYDRNSWVTYRRSAQGGGEYRIFENGTWRTEPAPQAPAGDFIWSIDFLDDTIWVGTASGLYTANLKR